MINIAYSETKFLHCPKLGSKDMYICLNNKYNDSAESESILFFVGYGGWKFPRWSEYKKKLDFTKTAPFSLFGPTLYHWLDLLQTAAQWEQASVCLQSIHLVYRLDFICIIYNELSQI